MGTKASGIGYVSFGWVGENREMEVVLKGGRWHTVHRVDGEPDPRMIKIYGSNELPTPWTEETSRETVIEELAARNGHAKIV